MVISVTHEKGPSAMVEPFLVLGRAAVLVGRALKAVGPEEFGKVVANTELAGLLLLTAVLLPAANHYQTLFHS
ncbi:hypothetical protein [Hymenobacter glacialis]|uniref:hypothetical protein n=1 Tax=Hymenobacter glacialis TaxID=1908236 RepID=UPI000F7B819E|nr:hypothetical protein [Hymenobacter glacialis]